MHFTGVVWASREIIVDLLCRLKCHARYFSQFFNARLSDSIDRFEMIQKLIPPLFTDSFDVIKHGVHGGIPVQSMVVVDRESVDLFLDCAEITEQDLFILKIYFTSVCENQRPRPVLIVLGHSEYRNVDFHRIQYQLRGIATGSSNQYTGLQVYRSSRGVGIVNNYTTVRFGARVSLTID